LLSSTCIVACQADAIKHMLQQPILSGRIRKYFCTNNQTEYEANLLGLQVLSSMGMKHVEAFGDPFLVMQQIVGTFQCLDGSLNAYLDKCLKTIALFDDFTMQHVFKKENTVANDLALQVSGF
jgi:ribonuclease HI